VTRPFATSVRCERCGALTPHEAEEATAEARRGQFQRLSGMPAWSNQVTLLPFDPGSD